MQRIIYHCIATGSIILFQKSTSYAHKGFTSKEESMHSEFWFCCDFYERPVIQKIGFPCTNSLISLDYVLNICKLLGFKKKL